jgi:hypothetical protein
MARPRRTKAEQDALDQWLQARAAENQALPLSEWTTLQYARDSALATMEDVVTRAEYEDDLPREWA